MFSSHYKFRLLSNSCFKTTYAVHVLNMWIMVLQSWLSVPSLATLMPPYTRQLVVNKLPRYGYRLHFIGINFVIDHWNRLTMLFIWPSYKFMVTYYCPLYYIETLKLHVHVHCTLIAAHLHACTSGLNKLQFFLTICTCE